MNFKKTEKIRKFLNKCRSEVYGKNKYKEVFVFKKGIYNTPIYDYSDIYGVTDTGMIVGSEILSGVDPDIGEFGMMISYQIKFDTNYTESLYDSVLRKVMEVGVFRPYKSSSRHIINIDGVEYVYVFCEDKEFIYLDDEVIWEYKEE
jgi:hypothetical protein